MTMGMGGGNLITFGYGSWLDEVVKVLRQVVELVSPVSFIVELESLVWKKS